MHTDMRQNSKLFTTVLTLLSKQLSGRSTQGWCEFSISYATVAWRDKLCCASVLQTFHV